MNTKFIILIVVGTVIVIALTYAWKLTARTSYETAPYTVVESSGTIEIREYPELIIASTDLNLQKQREDGSFTRLFRYINGANVGDKKIAMTTPVFFESQAQDGSGQMGFVMPESMSQGQIPEPTNVNVRISKRPAGRFAVIRFSGRMDTASVEKAEKKLLKWMEARGLKGNADAVRAGYDPPWTPGPLRRNELLIQLR